ncbi:hypothetical protein FE257_006282 [Aspergillus nanangensis]|uniref:Delta(24)-sterol reductase n=1 Tax=Aspergillus nanangensis TaxID=2582783 RepID=A0AAD4CP82_ASPNN|nr:hypothetical protein FE257_006282 [Aspergillus nanangensis]
MDDHETSVASLASQIQQFHRRQQPFRIYHGATSSTRQSPYSQNNIISTAHLTHVLQVNRKKQTVLVEPNVPMDQLAQATITHGLVPLVVMEFPGITAGGGFSGTSGESSSFRHGFFDATVRWVEIILPNGEIRTASPTKDADLFWGAASAFGTLGVITMLEIQCREAKPYIELQYQTSSNMADAMHLFHDATADPATEYLDGVVYARDHIVVCAGRLVESPPSDRKVQRFSRAQDPWFYIHAERSTRPLLPQGKLTEYVPLEDYLFRYDRGAFWTGRFAYKYFLTPFNRITRYLLDGFMHTRVMYHALHQSGLSNQYIIQDVAVPFRNATDEFLAWLEEGGTFNSYPIWLCPLRQSQHGGLITGRSSEEGSPPVPNEDEYMMNFGLWAPSPFQGNSPEFIAQNRRLEGQVRKLGGKKWLYANTYYTEEEFWSIYDRTQYTRLRERYQATYLPDLYQKVRVNLSPAATDPTWRGWVRGLVKQVWPLQGLYGVYKAWRGGDYLIQRKNSHV